MRITAKELYLDGQEERLKNAPDSRTLDVIAKVLLVIARLLLKREVRP